MTFVRSSQSLILGLLALLLVPTVALADIHPAAVLFLRNVNSAPANGMGGCAINRIDEDAPLYNPGASGLFYMNKSFAFSAPSNTELLSELADDLHLKTWSTGIGLSDDILDLGLDENLHYSMSLSYSKHTMDYGTVTRTDETGAVIGTYDSKDQATYYTVAAGVQYYLKAGLGFTYKKINSDLLDVEAANATGLDWGLIVEFPLMDMVDLRLPLNDSRGRSVNFDFTPSVAYVKANCGDSIFYPGAGSGDPLPAYSKLGLSLFVGASVDEARIASLRISNEKTNDLVSERTDIKQNGLEVNLLGVLNLRSGKYDDKDGEVTYNTSGVGLALGGVARWLACAGILGEKNSLLYRLANRIDINWDSASYSGEGTPVDKTDFVGVSVSI